MLPILLISSDKKLTDQYINDLIEKQSILPYYIFRISPLKSELTIDQIRGIKKELITENKNTRLVILYDFHLANIEAQNAFLKTLEEKNEHNQFILVVNNERTILPTIRSRTKSISLRNNTQKQEVSIELKQVLEDMKKGTTAFLLDPLIMNITRERAVQLIDELILYLHERLKKNNIHSARLLKQVMEYKSLLQNNNLNPQLTIDHIFLELLTFITLLD